MEVIQIIDQDTNENFTFYDNADDTIIRQTDGFEYSAVRAVIENTAGEQSGIYVTSRFGPRKVAWHGDLVGDDIFAKRRDLLKVLRQSGRMKLIRFTTYDNLRFQFEAEITKVLNPYTHKIHTYLIEATAPDWRFYSQSLKAITTGQTILYGGTSIPATIPMSFPLGDETTNNVYLVNDGNEVTEPIFKVYGPGNSFTIRNATTNKQFVLNHVLTGSDYITVDVKARTVIVNGITSIYNDLAGDFWRIEPGSNKLEFTVTGASDNTSLEVFYRDAWLGV